MTLHAELAIFVYFSIITRGETLPRSVELFYYIFVQGVTLITTKYLLHCYVINFIDKPGECLHGDILQVIFHGSTSFR